MRRILLNLIFLFTVFACTPATQDLEEKERDYFMDDEKDHDRLEEDQKTGDDSLSNRDMQAIAILRK